MGASPMQQPVVIVVDPNDTVAGIIRTSLSRSGIDIPCLAIREPATLEATLPLHPAGGVILLDVMALAPDGTGRQRPFWQFLAERPAIGMPVLCFTGSAIAPTDTTVFSPPPDTIPIASPQDFSTVTGVIQAYLRPMRRQPILSQALAGTLLPSFRGDVQDFDVEHLLQLIQQGEHTGVMILREGLRSGIIALEHGAVTHALSSTLMRKDAVFSLLRWETGAFAFYRGVETGEHTITDTLENLLLEASRFSDEVSDAARQMPPDTYVRRVRDYTDRLPKKEFTLAEFEVLAMMNTYHLVSELVQHARPQYSESIVLKALRSLKQKELIEIVPQGDPRFLVATNPV
jgi:hypothetical protein